MLHRLNKKKIEKKETTSAATGYRPGRNVGQDRDGEAIDGAGT